MTVQELIDELTKINDKSKEIKNTNGVDMNAVTEGLLFVYIVN